MATLHVTNGDCAADIIRRVVEDPVVITADVLHEGPAPAVDGQAWYQVRGSFLGNGHGTAEEISRQLEACDRRIADTALLGRVVLWFEHDLFDQLLLIRTLDLMVRLKPDTTNPLDLMVRLKPDTTSPNVSSDPIWTANADVASGSSRTAASASLICIDRFPGVERFIGLGQLSSGQMATLLGSDRPVTAEQYAAASAAWSAFRAPDPSSLAAIASDAERTRALPFLRDALLRFLAEFPSAANGLSRTEELALDVLRNQPFDAWPLFAATQAREPRPFMGDSSFFNCVNRLATARVPLVRVDGAPGAHDLRGHRVAITDEGRRVLDGEHDHVTLNGIDLWRGGVHLAGTDRSPWRWDARRETLVS